MSKDNNIVVTGSDVTFNLGEYQCTMKKSKKFYDIKVIGRLIRLSFESLKTFKESSFSTTTVGYSLGKEKDINPVVANYAGGIITIGCAQILLEEFNNLYHKLKKIRKK